MARKIICLAGSTKFKRDFIEQHQRLTLEGFIVFLPAIYGKSGDVVSEKEQSGLASLFYDIILMSDILFVVNPGGYIGELTASEIEFAKNNEKEIIYLSDHTNFVGCEDKLLEVVKRAYRKHVQDDPEIGWEELGQELMAALCCAMGEDGFTKWNGS